MSKYQKISEMKEINKTISINGVDINISTTILPIWLDGDKSTIGELALSITSGSHRGSYLTFFKEDNMYEMGHNFKASKKTGTTLTLGNKHHARMSETQSEHNILFERMSSIREINLV